MNGRNEATVKLLHKFFVFFIALRLNKHYDFHSVVFDCESMFHFLVDTETIGFSCLSLTSSVRFHRPSSSSHCVVWLSWQFVSIKWFLFHFKSHFDERKLSENHFQCLRFITFTGSCEIFTKKLSICSIDIFCLFFLLLVRKKSPGKIKKTKTFFICNGLNNVVNGRAHNYRTNQREMSIKNK